MPTVVATAADLFAPPPLPAGLDYREDFLARDEEARLLAAFATLPFREATFQQYTARRRVVRFGRDYAAGAGQWLDGEPLPEWLAAVRTRVARAGDLDESAFVHALVTEYRPGTPIGWHSDAPHFDIVVGISLAGAARMRFRPYAIKDTRARRAAGIELELAPRSAYVMQGEIRWQWQHHIPPTRQLRYSITFRTLRDSPGRAPTRHPPAAAEH